MIEVMEDPHVAMDGRSVVDESSRRGSPEDAAAATAAAGRAVYAVFALAGLSFLSFASRLADVKRILALSPGQLGTVLLAVSAGAMVGLPASGWFTHRYGAAQAVRVGLGSSLVGLLVAGLGVDVVGSRWIVMAGLLFAGIGIGVWDVGMNLEGAAVEQRSGRSIMPRFHAAFSAGTVVGALVGALMTALEVPVIAHVAGSAALVGIAGLLAVGGFLPSHSAATDSAASAPVPDADPEHFGVGRAWRERRTLLIGVVVLTAACTEGTANDWMSVAMHEGHHLPAWAGVLGFATFLACMTIGRLVGTHLLDRHGRVTVLRALFVLALVGALLVVFGGRWLAFVGAALWGLGASLGFPVGMSAAADDPHRAAARMSVVSTVGYLAFLGGPPLLGFLGDHVGVLHALLFVGALAAVAVVLAPVVERPVSER